MSRAEGPVDPLALLRRLDPIDEHEMPGTGDVDAERRYARIVADTPPQRDLVRRWRHRRTAVLLPAALGLVGATTAALFTRDVSDPSAFGCYSAAHTTADVIVAARGDGESPIDACRQLWLEGAFGGEAAPATLTECVLPDGVLAVFPVTDCSAVADSPGTSRSTASGTSGPSSDRPLPPASQEHTTTAARMEAVRDQLTERLLIHECPTVEQARQEVARLLEQGQLPGWELEVAQGFDASRPCASLHFDVERRRIELVPLGR